MKLLSAVALASVLLTMAGPVSAAVPANVVGRILLQVEANGEAWYVLPEQEERFYVKNGAAAYASLRTFGLGITEADLEKIPVGIEDRFEDTDTDGDGLADKLEEALGTGVDDLDSDNDGFTDRGEVELGYNPLGSGAMTTDVALVDRLRGQIVLQVESRGEAWYIHPVDGKRYYMKDGDAAYEIMRFLSLGITNNDLTTIPLLSTELDCGESFDCFAGAIESEVAATLSTTIALDLFGRTVESDYTFEHRLAGADGLYAYIVTTHEQRVDGVAEPQFSESVMTCTYTDTADMAAVIALRLQDTYSSSDMDFATCTSVFPNY